MLMGGVLSGCRPAPTPPPANTLRLLLGTDPPTLDPARVTDLVSYNVLLNLHRGLVAYSPDGRLVPAVAASWKREPRPNGVERWTFHLRPNARWSDGHPVTADQFVAAWRRALNPKQPAEYGWFFDPIVGAKALREGRGGTLAVWSVGPRQLVLEAHAPTPPYFLDLLTAPVALPIRPDLLKRHTADTLFQTPAFVGTGPYRLTTWDHGAQLSAKPNPHYRLGPVGTRPNLQWHVLKNPSVATMLYLKGEVDVVEGGSGVNPLEIRQLKARSDAHSTPLIAISYLGFNVAKPPFTTPQARCAVQQALPSRWLLKVLQSTDAPLWGLYPTAPKPAPMASFLPPPDQHGSVKRLHQIHQPITLGYRNTFPNQRLAEAVQFRLQSQLGTPVRLKGEDWKVFLERLPHDAPHLFRLDWYADYPDPDTFATLFVSDNPNNYTRWRDPQYDAWVHQAQRETHPQKRAALLARAERRLVKEACVILPLSQPSRFTLINPRVRGFQVNSLGLTLLDQVQLITP